MKIAIVGAGVNGLATAHELMLAGHDVVVYERHGTAAEDGSFAPAGLLHAAWALAWAQPQARLHPPWSPPGPGLRWRSGWRVGAWLWWRRWCAAAAAAAPDARQALLSLSSEGAVRHAALADALDLDHDRSEGLLVLAPDARGFERASATAVPLREAGLAVRAVSADEARTLEPALNPDAPLAGAVHLAGPAVANCREWTLLVRQALLRGGGRFLARQAVLDLRPAGAGIEVHTASEAAERHDAVVLCTGRDAGGLLPGLGLQAPLATWWSQSLSAPIREPMDAPLSAVLDTRNGVSLTRLGQRVRACSGWDLGGEDGPASQSAIAHLARSLSHWYPAAARLGGAHSGLQAWRGATLVSPDRLPLIGASRIPGIWLNLAHGPLGWAMAAGAACRLAEAITRRDPSIIAPALRPARLGL